MMQILEDEEKMTPEQFVYWLQGFMEMGEPEKLTKKQTQMIKDHLAQVFTKKTPEYTVSTTESPQISVQVPTFIQAGAHTPNCQCLECRSGVTIGEKPYAVIC